MMDEKSLILYGEVVPDFNLSKILRFGTGGLADFLVKPHSINHLVELMKNYSDCITVIGCGSNTLVRDAGMSGIIVKLENESEIKCKGNLVYAGAGARLPDVAYKAMNAGLSGLEFFVGIPGSVGGALKMNAGAQGKDTSSVLLYADAVDQYGKSHVLLPDDFSYKYRGNGLTGKWIFTEAVFKCKECESVEKIRSVMKEMIAKRAKTQPYNAMTCGSTFKNLESKPAWELIDGSGCRGLRVGGAIVSDLHCNFLINTGNATSTDIETLGNLILSKVYDKYGIRLDWEIGIIGKKH